MTKEVVMRFTPDKMESLTGLQFHLPRRKKYEALPFPPSVGGELELIKSVRRRSGSHRKVTGGVGTLDQYNLRLSGCNQQWPDCLALEDSHTGQTRTICKPLISSLKNDGRQVITLFELKRSIIPPKYKPENISIDLECGKRPNIDG